MQNFVWYNTVNIPYNRISNKFALFHKVAKLRQAVKRRKENKNDFEIGLSSKIRGRGLSPHSASLFNFDNQCKILKQSFLVNLQLF